MKNLGQWRDDVIAGFVGAVAGAPQAMGFALVAGVNPIYGLYTAVVSTIFGALFGKATFMTIGPTNALSLVVASTLGDFQGMLQIERLFMLTVLTGLFYLLFVMLRLGFLVRFVSNAVMTGFITGAGLLIIFGQVRHLNGYEPIGETALLKFFDWLIHLPSSNPQTVFIGAGALLLMLGLRRTSLKNLSTLIAIGVASSVVLLLDWNTVTVVRDISTVPQGLPAPILPDFSLAPELLTAACAIAVLGAVQSAAIANAVPEPDGKTPNFERDLLGMGLGNIIGGFFQGMPACGSLSRTAVNVNTGARTRWANAFSGGFVALILLLLGKAIEIVTLAALGAQLILAAISLIQPHEIRMVWRVSLPARAAMIATFISTLVLPLEYSIYVGVGISLALYLYSSSENIIAKQLIPIVNGRYRVAPLPEYLPDNDSIIISLHGSLYFAAVHRLKTVLPDPTLAQGTLVILRLREASGLGSTAIHFIKEYHTALCKHGGKLILSGVSPQMHSILERAGMIDIIRTENVFEADDVIFAATTNALDQAVEG